MGQTGSLVKLGVESRDCEWIYRIRANPGMPRGGIVPPAPVLAPGSALGSRPRVALSSAHAPAVYRGPRPPGNAGAGSAACTTGPKSPLEVRARIRRTFQDPRHEEDGRGGVGLGVYIYNIIILLYFYQKEDCPRRDCEHLRPPICPATFRRIGLRALHWSAQRSIEGHGQR